MLDDQDDPRKSWQECCKRQTTLRALRLEGCNSLMNVSNDWHEAAMKKDFSSLDEVEQLPATLTPDNFTQTMMTLLKMEEAYEHINRRKFDMFDQEISIQYQEIIKGKKKILCYYEIQVEGVSSGQQKLAVNDIVILHEQPDSYKALKIVRIWKDLVWLSSIGFKDDRGLLSGRLDVFFVSSGILYRYYKRAIYGFTYDRSIVSRLFELESKSQRDGSDFDEREGNSDYFEEANLDNTEEMMDRLNKCQRQAITSIQQGTSWPRPYILFGPPGTGKTHTLAVAIGQIYINQPSKRVLYCANSNTCANQMVDKLRMIQFIKPGDIVRLSAGDRPEVVGSSRIVLTTNMKASCMMEGYKFDYVFIDEAAHAHEAETLIPIACLRPSGTLVLAGDPKQLGAVVQCNQAVEYGLAISTLERIFSSQQVYQRDRESKKYDSRYITKLVVSYRCDPRVLAISNELFYDGELQCPNETPKSLLEAMRIANPLQLFSVDGLDVRPADSTSWYNDMEAECCVDQIVRLYKVGLRPDQIGVISPYKLQANLIYRKLDDRLKTMRVFLEERLREDELVRQVKIDQESSDDARTSSITYGLDILKLGEKEESVLGKQEEEVEAVPPYEHPSERALSLGRSLQRNYLHKLVGWCWFGWLVFVWPVRIGFAWFRKLCIICAALFSGYQKRRTTEAGSGETECEIVEETKERSDNWICKIDSVDAFQGNEREVIIISTVRTPMSGGRKDFINDSRRFNVAISRAKWLVFVIGHKEVLAQQSNWKEFVSQASEEASYVPKQSLKQFSPLFR